LWAEHTEEIEDPDLGPLPIPCAEADNQPPSRVSEVVDGYVDGQNVSPKEVLALSGSWHRLPR
jgi:hypothetical protein